MTIRTAPCDWPMDYGQCPHVEAWELLSASAKGVYEGVASEYLWHWTGQVFGLCPVTIEPCRTEIRLSTFGGGGGSLRGGGWWHPVSIDGLWYNLSCGTCWGASCACPNSPSSVKLPGPIADISSVIIDGVTLDPSTYRVVEHTVLERLDGVWPNDGWSVSYTIGVPVPQGGRLAAALLAIELFKASCGDKSCGLPQRVQSITRQGVTIAVLDAFDDVDKGHTGIWLIDSWVASVTKPPPRSVVLSPDMPRRRRVTSP